MGLVKENQENSVSTSHVPFVHDLEMEVDTGAAVSITSSEMYRYELSHVRLRCSNVVPKTYTGEVILPEGVIKVGVKLNRQSEDLPLYVVTGKAVPLLG